jgi:hypothetical protein
MRRPKIAFSQVSVIPRTAETFKPTDPVGFFFWLLENHVARFDQLIAKPSRLSRTMSDVLPINNHLQTEPFLLSPGDY